MSGFLAYRQQPSLYVSPQPLPGVHGERDTPLPLLINPPILLDEDSSL